LRPRCVKRTQPCRRSQRRRRLQFSQLNASEAGCLRIMSLSRILNDSAPRSPPPSTPAYVSDMAIDPALMEIPMHSVHNSSLGSPSAAAVGQLPTYGPHHHHPPSHEGSPSFGSYYPHHSGYAPEPWPSQAWDAYGSDVWNSQPDQNSLRPHHQDAPYSPDRGVQPHPPSHIRQAPTSQVLPATQPLTRVSSEPMKRKRGEQSTEKRVSWFPFVSFVSYMLMVHSTLHIRPNLHGLQNRTSDTRGIHPRQLRNCCHKTSRRIDGRSSVQGWFLLI